MDSIFFYKTNDAFGFLSNFAPYRVFIDGLIWPTSEHYFQASKFDEYNIRERIRAIESPMKAAKEGRNRDIPIRSNWELIKDDIMRKAIRAKFMQHHRIKVELLNTKGFCIVEQTVNDHYWGDGGDGSGKNMLGVLLMELRKSLEEICPIKEWVYPPWIAFPELEQYDMFWRMGLGENYMYIWAKWFNSQDLQTKKDYEKYFPSILEWDGFYG
jgi:ribA/ribD-fused uncharacterized protein